MKPGGDINFGCYYRIYDSADGISVSNKSSVTKTVMIQGPPIEKHGSEPDVASGLPGHVRM